MGGVYPPAVVVETGSAEETEALGARLAANLHAGDVVAVTGELGAGKTTFVRGACRELGVDASCRARPSRSATATRPPCRSRISTSTVSPAWGPEEWGDLEPYFDGTIAFGQWPEHAGAWLPPIRAAVSLEHVDERHRRVRIESENDLRL